MADMLRELLAGFFQEIMGTGPKDLGVHFEQERAEDAYLLVRKTADIVNEMPVTNATAGMFPRVQVHDHSDIQILQTLVTDRAEELKDALLAGAGKYALGASHLAYNELADIADEYATVGRLANALDALHQEWHTEEARRKVREANAVPDFAPWEQELVDQNLAQARDTFPKPAATSEPITEAATRPSWQSYDPARLLEIARRSPVVKEHIMYGRQIQAIKELRTIAQSGLKEAKEACDSYRTELQSNPLL